jgi:hypothetical protein
MVVFLNIWSGSRLFDSVLKSGRSGPRVVQRRSLFWKRTKVWAFRAEGSPAKMLSVLETDAPLARWRGREATGLPA